ncbi:MAG TPA: hypothetical protein VH478_12960 [Trebonia sp.]|jgi:hypothetical protein|nr:hypothetical protein [Trebonia sp.]
MNKKGLTRIAWGAAATIFLGMAVAVPSGAARAATPPAALNGGVAGFEAANSNLYLCDIPKNGCVNTGLGMKAGASPSVYSMDNGLVWAAFEANTGKLYVTERSSGGAVKNIDTGLDMANLTTPSITYFKIDPNNSADIVVAFHGATGVLSLYDYNISSGRGSWLNTGLAMYAGTSPSAVAATDGFTDSSEIVVAFENTADHLGVAYAEPEGGGGYYTTASTATTLGMAAGTSPSITATSPSGSSDNYQVALNDNANQLYLASFGWEATQSSMHLQNVGAPIYPGTSPSLVQAQVEGANSNEVTVYAANTGFLCAWNDTTDKQNCGFNQVVGETPSVSFDSGAYWSSFDSGSSDNFRAVNTATLSYFEQPIYSGTTTAMSS